MRFRSTFRLPISVLRHLFLKSKTKATPPRSRSQLKASACSERVLEACKQLPALAAEPIVLREHLVSSAAKIFKAAVAAVLLRAGEKYASAAVVSERDEPTREALIAHARSFASQAIEQKKLLNFRFSYRAAQGENIYPGLAQPLTTSEHAAVLLVVRSAPFSSSEASAFAVLGNLGRLALDNSELAGLCSSQKQELDQLLEISAELGATSRLESFLPRFVVRAAEFMGFSRAFVALIESGDCRMRWGTSKGSPSRLEIDISAVGNRVLETRLAFTCEDLLQLPANERTQLLRWEAGLKQFLGIPLMTGDGRPLGVLGLLDRKNKTQITPEDVRRARVLGAEITVALEAAHNLQLSDQHRKRTEDLMEMALDLGSALRLPDFVKNFTERVAEMIGANAAVLALAQGNKVECVGFYGAKPERELERKLNAAFSEYAERHPDLKISGSGVQAMGSELVSACGWQNLTLVRLEGTEGDL